jgi:glycosyltransferase involved in cell wall biosynthesis
MVHIALTMMVKNEEKRLHVTLESVKGIVSSMIIFDTGSEDSTLTILRDFSEKNNIPLRLKEGGFVDFSTSRNVLLDFADTFEDVDFLLMMDCNDELKGGKALIQFCKTKLETPDTSWMMCQQWYSGISTKYYNIRLIKPRATWRYRGVVHEWIQKQDDKDFYCTEKIPDKIVLFQDRTLDDDKTGKRFIRDRILLLEEHEKNPTDDRTVFYLAQTCSCLGSDDEAYKYYTLRANMGGFHEEVFNSHLRLGDLARRKNMPWEVTLGHFMTAIEHTPRVEPVIAIAEHYRDIKHWVLFYTFSQLACNLSYPTNTVLFVDDNLYNYTRWHLLGIAAFYVGQMEIGIGACKKAIEVANQDIDKNNLKIYEDTLKNRLPPPKRGLKTKRR